MKKITTVLSLLFFVVPSVSFAAGLTSQQATNLIAVVQSSPGTPANVFVSLITSFSNITVNQATSLITVVQTAPSVPASAFVNLLISFTVDTSVTQPATSATAPISTTNTAPAPQVQAPTVSNNELQDGLAEFYAQFSLSSVESGIPQLLSILSNEQIVANSNTQLNAQCVSTYNSDVIYFQQQGQNELDSARETMGMGISVPALNNIKAQTQHQLDNLKTTENSCLASYPVDPTLSGQISQITSQLNQLQLQVQANPTSLSEIASILKDYNSLQGQVLGINSSMQTSVRIPSQVPSSGFISCSSQGGYYNCSGSGVSTSCSSVGSNSLNCSSTNGQNISCTTQGGYVNCSY